MIIKKSVKKPPKENNFINEEIKRAFGVILEDINGKFDFLIESQQGLAVQTKKLEERVDDLIKEINYKFYVVFDDLALIK